MPIASLVQMKTERGSAWLMRGVIAVAVMVAFGFCIGGQFVGWDDNDLITQNAKVNPPTVAGLARLWGGPDHQMYIPVVYTAWWTLAHVPGNDAGHLSAATFHGTNLIVHVISAWAVFEILLMLVKSKLAACAGAIVFAVHPLQTEPVSWATGLKDVLSGCLAVVAVWQYLRARKTSSVRSMMCASGAFAMALLAKPSTVCVPVICGVLDWAMGGKRSWSGWVLWGWLATAVVVAFIAAKVQPTPANLAAVSITQRPLIAADSLTWYVTKILWPTGLLVDYSRTPQAVLASGWAVYKAIAVAAILAGVVATAAISWQREWIASLLIFIAALLPVLGLTPFVFQKYSTVADRYAYLALLGPALACAAVLAKFEPRKWLAPAGAVCVALMLVSARQTVVWHDSLSLFSHTLELNPQSLAATRSLGFYWAQKGDDTQAAGYFEMANRTHPEDSTNHFNYANLFLRHGMVEQALSHYQQAIEMDPANAQYQLNYGVALASAGQNETALAAFDKATALNPSSADAWQNAGLMLEKLGRLDEAKSAFAKALQCDPSRVVARQHLEHLQ